MLKAQFFCVFHYFVLKAEFFWVLHHICVNTCVLLKINQFLLKMRFCIKSRMRKTFFVLNCVFHYFVLKAVFLAGSHNMLCLNLRFAKN